MERLRGLSNKLGFVGLGTLGVAFGLTAFALASGVHCPDCDQPPAYEAWKTYFAFKDVVYGGSLLLLVAAVPLAPRRAFFIIGALIAAVGCLLTPM